MMIVRKAKSNDAGAIARVHVNVWRSAYAGIVSQQFLDDLSPQKRETMWARVLAAAEADQRSNIIFVVEDRDGQIVGFIDGGPPRSMTGEFDCELNAIYIEDHAQRQGFGAALTLALCKSFLELNLTKMIVWVLEGNAATCFYERIGGRLLKEKKSITIGGQEYTCIGYGYDVPGLVTALLAGRNQKSNSNRSAAN